MNIFMTGAAGYIGGSVAQVLMVAGPSPGRSQGGPAPSGGSERSERGGQAYRVRGLTRSAPTADRLAASGIEPVLGTLDDTDLLIREARASDGVINAASADHAGAAQALVMGLEGSAKPLLHTSGSSVVADDARGSFRSENTFDEDTPWSVHPAKQARRDIDLWVLGAAQRGVRSAVICPSLIYGSGRGLGRHSVQIPFLVANARAKGAKGTKGAVQIVGAGLNVWSNVHIDDLVTLYTLALVHAPAGAFYFAENGEASFADVGTALARRLGLSAVESLPPDEAAERWGEPRAYYSFGSNSRVRAVRARHELNWAPRHASVVDWILDEMPVDDGPHS